MKQNHCEVIFYDEDEKINADFIDKKLHDIIVGCIENDQEEIEDNDCTVEDVKNDFVFLEKQKELDKIKGHLCSTEEASLDCDYEDYENSCKSMK